MTSTAMPASIDYLGHISLWVVLVDGHQVAGYRTRAAAQRLANKLNGEVTRRDINRHRKVRP